MATWMLRAAAVILGGGAGFAYYYFVGCATGSCPITSNPFIATGYGAVLAGLVAWPLSTGSQPRTQAHTPPQHNAPDNRG